LDKSIRFYLVLVLFVKLLMLYRIFLPATGVNPNPEDIPFGQP